MSAGQGIRADGRDASLAASEAQVTLLSDISRAMVRVYKEQFGRGPTLVRTHFAGPNTIVCTLEQTLTPAERTLVELGEHQRLREMRMLLQYAQSDQFTEPVETLTGRRVRAFLSSLDTMADVACEIFVLAPIDAINHNGL